jgi:signal transduction histidine kinase
MKHFILLVDDETDNLDALERIFRRKYNVLKASQGEDALSLLKNQNVTIILSDQRMPKMTGVEFLRKSIAIQPNAIRILLTGYTDIESVIDSINSGQIYKYLTKPWDPHDLLNTIDKAVEKYELKNELKEKNLKLELALRDLKELDNNKTQFLTLINHELKTPLTILKSYNDLLKESSLNEEQLFYCNKIDQSFEKLHSIVIRSLLLVESTNKTIAKNLTPISLTKILKATFTKYEFTKEANELNLNQLNLVMALENELTIVLDELIKNVRQHAEDSFSIQLKNENQTLDICLSNKTKQNIKNPEKLLKPFFIDEEILNHSQGLGLGLSIVEQNLKIIGSHLKINCESDKLTVCFQLLSCN